ncbi:DUF3592 domain-containing protein [Fimbriimonas ginsengisoli]|uniref:DUF3592 domain-containing protein n=1 Tax=Fimbriimonas ginsengisoli Gsoil 348 TaxID=661478 RepID=A0A068NVR0_FIMGI|nr:DUF3592 domain-containing protein [Fimbriimonas ginsengisoli]AIE87526.1 hypothetical protein OP10G_4158 [Fimbriimonas ginsengisoli Gsoil 348]
MDESSREWLDLPFEQYGPRPVVASRLANLSKFWARFALAATLLIGGYLGVRDVGDLRQLQVHGKQIQARVLDMHQTTGKNTAYWITYSYDLSGKTEDFQEEVDRETFESTSDGSTILVTALPADPSVHRRGFVDEDRIAKARFRWTAGTVILGLIFEGIFLAVADKTRKEMRILRDFYAGPGRITAMGPPKGTKVKCQDVEFIYRHPNGIAEKGTVNLESSRAAKYKVDKPIIAMIDPQAGQPAVLYDTLTMARLDT